MKKKIVILSGAGISAESGLKTFRDHDGLWEGHDVYEVATPEGWLKNPTLVQRFYNMRRDDLRKALPNAAHLALKDLEAKYEVLIITQNVDDLHERAGSKMVMHLHGQLMQAKSTANPALIYDLADKNIEMGDKCELGSQLRPNIVWFGEDVPMMFKAIHEMPLADIVILVGSSMVVYPAASLLEYVKANASIYVVDPVIPQISFRKDIYKIAEKATVGIPQLVAKLLAEA